MNGVCQGAAFKCRSCETCGGSGCRIKPGFCMIRGICCANGDIIQGTQCLVIYLIYKNSVEILVAGRP